ncbi:MAG: hypothetical protein IPO78_17435 [Saprospiraceae bacterium]|nr:hypothetical protein [Saprospiraceae bacterium]
MINASLQYVDGTALLAIGDRDNGDITTSGSGLTWTIDNGTISTAKLADSSVTTVKLISNAVGTTALASSAVTTLKIASNAVDGTKIAMGSDAQGDILYYDGTDYVRLAPGTSGHYLKTQGAAANPVWAAVAGISDGDKGDITVSSSGTVWTVDNLAITNAKINDVAWSKITSTPTTLSGYGITDALSNSTTSTQDGYFGNINLKDDTSPSHYLTITDAENLTADRILSLSVNDAARSISLSGNLTVSSSATISGTNTGDQTITLTGDVTGSGTGSFATTVADNSVDGTDIALGSDAQGDVMYYDGTNWVRLAAGTNGYFLKTQGAGANPVWAAGSADGNGIYSGQGRIPDMTYAKVGLNQANPDAFLIGNFTDSTELQYNARERGLLFSQSTNNVYLVKSDSANANYSFLTLSDRGSLTSSNTAGTKYTTVDIYGNSSNNYFILESYNDPEQTYVRGSADSLFIRTDQIRIDVDTFSLKIGGPHGTNGQVLTSNGGSPYHMANTRFELYHRRCTGCSRRNGQRFIDLC